VYARAAAGGLLLLGAGGAPHWVACRLHVARLTAVFRAARLSSSHIPAGDKCKYSHDLTIGRKAAKADIYSDKREVGADKKDDVMEDWDQAKLESVVKTKHGAEKGQVTKTDIVCMYFLDALEKELYGWFWECPVRSRVWGREGDTRSTL
jgi:hypothetical protein